LYYDTYEVPWLFFLKMGFLLLLIILVLSYIGLLLNEFIVAIMYKQRISATQAWSRFLNIHWSYLLQFFGFALLWLVFSVAAIILIVMAGLLTCCLGFLLLIIPYINAVALLPVSYTFRSFSLEFIAQFGNEYNVFTKEEFPTSPHAVG
jgi:hypothetical protein